MSGVDYDALDRSYTRLGRALLAMALALGAGPIAQLGALIGPYVPEVGTLLIIVGIGCLIGAVGLLISCAFVGSSTPATEPPSAREQCHCTNCMNAKARQ